MSVTVSDYLLLPPNWNSTVYQKRIWMTNIQTTIEEGEKRSALFTWPRRNIRYSVQCMTIPETNYIRRKLYKNAHNVFGIPLWTEWTQLSALASSGQAVLNVDSTENRNFEVGGECILLTDENTYEVGTILSKTSSSITFDANLSSSWADNTYVYPILKCQLTVNQTGKSEISGYDTFDFEFLEVPDPDLTHFLFTDGTAPTYNSLPVFIKEPNWLSSLDMEYKHNYDMLKFLGAAFISTSAIETNMTLRATFLNIDKDELYTVLGFFDDMRGRWGAFWLPSFNDDIQVTSAILSTDTTINITDVQWSSYWNGMDVVGQHLRIRFPDGTIAYKEIDSAPTSTSLTLNTAIGTDVTTAELPFLHISFLFLVRFDIDEIEIKNDTDSISNIELKFATIYGATL
jgi:hypothetical protein